MNGSYVIALTVAISCDVMWQDEGKA